MSCLSKFEVKKEADMKNLRMSLDYKATPVPVISSRRFENEASYWARRSSFTHNRMSVDAEFSDGPFILTDEKLPEVVNSAVACENASRSGVVVSTKEILNCPADKGQMEHNPTSEITGAEKMCGAKGFYFPTRKPRFDNEKIRNQRLRGQLYSNNGSQDEVQKTLDEREVNEERMMNMSKTNKENQNLAECSSVDDAVAKDMNLISAKGFYFPTRKPRFDNEKIRNKRLSSNNGGSQDKVQKSVDEREVNEERLRNMSKTNKENQNSTAAKDMNLISAKGFYFPTRKPRFDNEKIRNKRLSSNIGSQDEVQKSLDEREVNEERLRNMSITSKENQKKLRIKGRRVLNFFQFENALWLLEEVEEDLTGYRRTHLRIWLTN